MCGISGWSLAEPGQFNLGSLKEMRQRLFHRGPDDEGVYFAEEAGVGLAHNRLSIIDLSGSGHQPMIDPSSGNVLSFNGEIYNFQTLRKELEGTGQVFLSNTDTEVLLKAFAQWGINCLEKVKGMFAFALWESHSQKLYLARDPMGIKPLYYWIPPYCHSVVFASEIKAFLGLPGFSRTVNQSGLGQYMEFGFGLGEATIFQDVFRLMPGRYMEIQKGKISQRKRYFSPPPCDNSAVTSKQDIQDQLFETLDTVVKEHLIADVPTGLLLSGGLDSSLIASLASRHQKIKTFSMWFENSAIDERPYARKVSQFIGSDHHEIKIEAGKLVHGLESNVAYFDDIFADWGMISTRLLYEKCRQQGIKVVVVGEGADELFGGYDSFKYPLNHVVSGFRDWHIFQIYRKYVGRRYGRGFVDFRRLMIHYLKLSKGDWFSAIRLFETQNQLPNNYVMKVDKASMAVSIEARTPYLDRRIAEIAYRLPQEFLVSKDDEKIILKEMARRHQLLPEEVLARRKFGAPIATSWIEDDEQFRTFAREIILDPGGWVDQLNLRRGMTDYFDRGKTGFAFPYAISIFQHLAWRLLLLNLWSRSYLQGV